MFCLEEVYKCLQMFSVVNVYLDHLTFGGMCINDRRYACCSECNVVSNECNESPNDTVYKRVTKGA